MSDNAASPERKDAGARRTLWWRFNRFLERHLPEGLYRRSLIIVIAPMVLLQAIMAGIFLERHWERVTKTLSKSLGREIGFIVALYEEGPKTEQAVKDLERLANEQLAIGMHVERNATLPPPPRKPFFSLLDYKLSKYVARYTRKPFWLDTIGQSGYVDVRILVDKGLVFRFLTSQKRAYASSTHIFLLWMVGTSLVLLVLAVVFLHKQIKPILKLAEAAQAFGMGRDAGDFEPRGAAEVRAAARAFINMKRRIERHVEQRTAMLAGVSHDLRTILTRFRLELAVLGEETPEVAALSEDVDEMQRMLEGYIAFVRGDGGEQTSDSEICAILQAVREDLRHGRKKVVLDCPEGLRAPVKPAALKRCLGNLAANAVRHARSRVEMKAWRDDDYLRVVIDDDGPGIPEAERERVFRPFVRLDDARNLNEAGTGLGLAIALDIAHNHGGDIELADSPLGGLRAEVRIPV